MPPRLSVVIPSWNTRELLRACLEHLEAAEKPETFFRGFRSWSPSSSQRISIAGESL